MKRAVLYLRVSKQDQSTENQQLELERVASAKGWDIVDIYRDEGISGAYGRSDRSQYDLMLKNGVRAQHDIVMAWDVSRLSRSLSELVKTLEDLHASGIDLYLHQQAIDTTTPSGKAMFQMCGVFAEFERGILSERVKSGLNRARQQGKILGRPVKVANFRQIIDDRSKGKTIRELAVEYELSVGKIHKILKSQDQRA